MSLIKFLLTMLVLTLPAYVVDAHATDRIEQRLTPAQMQATGLNTLSAKQLALLNQLLQEKVTQSPSETVQQSSPPYYAPSPVNVSATVAPMATPILSNEPFKSRIIGSFSAWQTGTVFTLENGQQWQVNKGSAKLFEALQNPLVNVDISLVGKWYFEFNEDLPKAMVTRIK